MSCPPMASVGPKPSAVPAHSQGPHLKVFAAALLQDSLAVSVRNTFLHCEDSPLDDEEATQPLLQRARTAPPSPVRNDGGSSSPGGSPAGDGAWGADSDAGSAGSAVALPLQPRRRGRLQASTWSGSAVGVGASVTPPAGACTDGMAGGVPSPGDGGGPEPPLQPAPAWRRVRRTGTAESLQAGTASPGSMVEEGIEDVGPQPCLSRTVTHDPFESPPSASRRPVLLGRLGDLALCGGASSFSAAGPWFPSHCGPSELDAGEEDDDTAQPLIERFVTNDSFENVSVPTVASTSCLHEGPWAAVHRGVSLDSPAGSSAAFGEAPARCAAPHAEPSQWPMESQPAAAAPLRRTTLMLRNLPNNYTRSMLLELLNSHGFSDKYDFLYMPIDFKTHAALGYAFVNLVTTEDAERMMRRLDGFSRWTLSSGKVCSVCWSHPTQGLDSHIARYRNSPLMHDDVPDAYRPILLRDGVRIPFPPPTKKIKPPRQGTQRMLV